MRYRRKLVHRDVCEPAEVASTVTLALVLVSLFVLKMLIALDTARLMAPPELCPEVTDTALVVCTAA